MTHPRTGIVFNPSKIERSKLESAWEAAGGDAEVSWFETTPEDPGQGPARQAIEDGCELVIAAGGDGTVRAVAEALAGTGTQLGIVPQGTGNLLARNLGVPLGKPETAFRFLLTNEPRPLDLGWVEREGEEPEAFVVMVGFGVDAEMLAATDDALKSQAGWLAYVAAMGPALNATKVVTVDFTIDGDQQGTIDAHTVLIGNCGVIQGGVTLLPDAKLDDGKLDVLAISADGPMQWMDTLRTAFWDNGVMRLFDPERTATSTDSARHRQVDSVAVTLSEPRAFEIDGEEIGQVQSFSVRVDPGALLIR